MSKTSSVKFRKNMYNHHYLSLILTRTKSRRTIENVGSSVAHSVTYRCKPKSRGRSPTPFLLWNLSQRQLKLKTQTLATEAPVGIWITCLAVGIAYGTGKLNSHNTKRACLSYSGMECTLNKQYTEIYKSVNIS